jgi:putative DNA primase/helicase
MRFASLGIMVNPHGETEQRIPCPQCNKGHNDKTLGVNIEVGIFHCYRCHWKGSVARGASPTPCAVRRDDKMTAERKRERLIRTWRETVSLDQPEAEPVRRYLELRALAPILHKPPSLLRAHPALDYWEGPCLVGRFPAMIAQLHSPAGDPATLHVTYLQLDGSGKAAVAAPKKVLPVPRKDATKGGAIRLFDPVDNVLGVAEGIETALSLRLISGIAVWAAYCADNLARVELPSGLRELQISVDIDASGKGHAVARGLAQRVLRASPTTRVRYVKPDIDGLGDLNDEWQRRCRDV